MKRIISILMATAFVLAFGTAYAGVLSNGITGFSGGSSDTFPIASGGTSPGEGAGSGDVTVVAVSNGVTDFIGGSYDLFVIGPSDVDMDSAEGTAAGGFRMDTEPAPYNGVTDFSGASRDAGEIGL